MKHMKQVKRWTKATGPKGPYKNKKITDITPPTWPLSAEKIVAMWNEHMPHSPMTIETELKRRAAVRREVIRNESS